MKKLLVVLFILLCFTVNGQTLVSLKAHYIVEVPNSPLRLVNYFATLEVPAFRNELTGETETVIVVNFVIAEPFYFYSQDAFNDWYKELMNVIKLNYELMSFEVWE